MTTHYIYFEATASAFVEVDIDKGASADEAGDRLDRTIETAYEELDTSQCHHCASKFDLGDFQFSSVEPA